MKKLMMCLSAVGMAIFITSCFRAQEAFLTVQVCVVDQKGVEYLKRVMHSIAKSENIRFVDNSAKQGNDLRASGADKLLKRDPAFAIDVHIEGKGGMGVTAGNLGLPIYQVALGFTEGSNPAQAHRLSDRLIETLSQRWHVETVPPGKGVFPMESCGDETSLGHHI